MRRKPKREWNITKQATKSMYSDEDPSLLWENDPYVVRKTPERETLIKGMFFGYIRSNNMQSTLRDHDKDAYAAWCLTHPTAS